LILESSCGFWHIHWILGLILILDNITSCFIDLSRLIILLLVDPKLVLLLGILIYYLLLIELLLIHRHLHSNLLLLWCLQLCRMLRRYILVDEIILRFLRRL